jgi:CheY-like chemotaxis protein
MTEVVNGVQVYRLPRLELFKKTSYGNLSRAGLLFLKLKSSLGYLFEYCYFTAACLVVSFYVFIRRGFDVIHAHNPPDTLFVVALPFKLLGKKFIFDHHDLCPELYRSRYRTGEGFFTRLLRVFEWCSLKLADITVALMRSDSLHVCSFTPGRVTSPLPPMLHGCHATPRILLEMRVLVVEDHATLAGRIAQGLRQVGIAADVVHDGAAALDAAAQTAYDVIVLDRDLPVVHGDRVCRTVAGSGPRVLMLTAAADVEDRVDGLELGADDYLGKPFVFTKDNIDQFDF